MQETKSLTVCATPEALAALAPLLREGVQVLVRSGRTLRETLVEDLNLCPDCVQERIQTVFLDGSPVDDIDADHARPGSTLALAGALPGVAGIAMRRGSPVGVFREGVTHQAGPEAAASAKPLRLTLKLFNTVAVECLAKVLARGIDLRAGRLAELLAENPEALASASFTLNAQPLARPALIASLTGGQETLNLKASA